MVNRCILVLLIAVIVAGCQAGPTPTPTASPTVTLRAAATRTQAPRPLSPTPPVVSAHHVELDAVSRVSLFRSGVGHGFSDSYESCSSMKHYYQFRSELDWSEQPVHAPWDGQIVRLMGESSGLGSQIWIAADADPSFVVRIFHITPLISVAGGMRVDAGALLGHHVSNSTFSDITVQQSTSDGFRFLSPFVLMTNALFEDCRARGISNRGQMQITVEERQAHPLSCDGGRFELPPGYDTDADWVVLD